jgi:hypothetical protein
MKICIWRYLENDKNYPGYHISVDSEGAEAIARVLCDPDREQVSFKLSSPTSIELAVPNNMGGDARFESFAALSIKTIPTSNKSRKLFTVYSHFPALNIEGSRDQLKTFAKHIRRCVEGYIDYSWGTGKENRFTFW